MTNLLPETYKKTVRREYNIRRLIVGLLLLGVTGLIAVVMLFPSYMIVRGQRDAARSQLIALEEVAKENETAQHIERMERANQRIAALEPPEAEARAYVVLNAVLERTADAIEVTGMTLEVKDAPEKEGAQHQLHVSLSGIAETREALVEFEQAMMNVTHIEEVELPVSSFASRSDISFTVNLIGYF